MRGLDNFDVGLSNVFPTEGSAVSVDSYTLCGLYNDSVIARQNITVNCAPLSQRFRYVVVRSSDDTAERLCIAEVAVYNASQCNYVPTGLLVLGTAITLTTCTALLI